MKDTLTLVCAKHGTTLSLGKQKVPGYVEVLTCAECLDEARIEGRDRYRKWLKGQGVLGV